MTGTAHLHPEQLRCSAVTVHSHARSWVYLDLKHGNCALGQFHSSPSLLWVCCSRQSTQRALSLLKGPYLAVTPSMGPCQSTNLVARTKILVGLI